MQARTPEQRHEQQPAKANLPSPTCRSTTAARWICRCPTAQALVHHPDGYYWLGAGGRLQIGPYATAEEALADLHRAADDDIEPDESLPEAEQALGLSDWLDPDTGELAEATHTRLEDH
jgi:hypothetical protein